MFLHRVLLAQARRLEGRLLWCGTAGLAGALAGHRQVPRPALNPPLLALIGRRIDRYSIGGARREGAPWAARALDRLLRKPGVVAAALTIPLLLLASPAIALNLGPTTVDQLVDLR